MYVSFVNDETPAQRLTDCAGNCLRVSWHHLVILHGCLLSELRPGSAGSSITVLRRVAGDTGFMVRVSQVLLLRGTQTTPQLNRHAA